MLKSFASGLHEEWSNLVNECIGLISPVELESVTSPRPYQNPSNSNAASNARSATIQPQTEKPGGSL